MIVKDNTENPICKKNILKIKYTQIFRSNYAIIMRAIQMQIV